MSYHEQVLATEIETAGFPKPVREHRFHPTRKWRLDFSWPDHKLALEVEGGIWAQGRHTRGQGFIDDCEKYNEAALLGWTVLRVPTDWVESGQALPYVKRLLDLAKEASA